MHDYYKVVTDEIDCYKVVLNGPNRFMVSEEKITGGKGKENSDRKCLTLPSELLEKAGKFEKEDKDVQKPITSWVFRKVADWLAKDVYGKNGEEVKVKWDQVKEDRSRVFGMEAALLENTLTDQKFQVYLKTEEDKDAGTKVVTFSAPELAEELIRAEKKGWVYVRPLTTMILNNLNIFAKHTEKRSLREWVGKAAQEAQKMIGQKAFLDVVGGSKHPMTVEEAFDYCKRLVQLDNSFIFKMRFWEGCVRIHMDEIRIDKYN